MGSQSQQSIVRVARERPNPPPKLPPNRSRPGGGLSNDKQSCKAASESLTALIPDQNPVLTTKAHPTILVYVPDTAVDMRLGRFSILTQDEKTRVYSTHFILPQAPGIISIRPPESSNYALAEGQSYHWYLTLSCKQADGLRADLNVDGWIQRVASTPERQQLIKSAAPDIWYDALANLASNLKANPRDSELQNQWNYLLRSIGMGNLATQPLIGPVWPLKIRL
ncbi:MAG: DUF928 domain-containing protein [Kovacikia sp.]